MRKITPQTCRVMSNRRLDKVGRYFRLTIDGFRAARPVSPGQFVHVKVAEGLDPFFRRAFSIAGYTPEKGILEIIYKVVGRGSSALSGLTYGDRLDLIGPLGNRFSRPPKAKTAILAAGGVGLPPLYFLARHLVDKGHPSDRLIFIYGGRTQSELIELPRIRQLGITTVFCTDDGSYGYRGLVTEAVARHLDGRKQNQIHLYGCGPEPMLAALQNLALAGGWSGELSLEAPMPCGVGVCLGCIKPSLKRPGDYVRVCYDGPVFGMGEVQL